MMRTAIKSICSYYSYCGLIDVYTHLDTWKFDGGYEHEDIYYGHYGLCRGFDGDDVLITSYINLIAD
ncbi:MAG: hypothetical protein ACI4XF_10745 [Oscillospiraceae bacterium]